MDQPSIFLAAYVVSIFGIISLYFLLRIKHNRSVIKEEKLKAAEKLKKWLPGPIEKQQKPNPMKKINKSSEEKPFYNFRRAEEERKLKNYDEAIRFYTKNIDIHNGHSTSYFFRAKCLQDKKLYHRAITDYTKAKNSLHDKYECLISITICHFNLGRYSMAIENCDLAIAQNPQKSIAFYWKGLSFLNSKDYRNASFAFIEAKELG